MLLLELIERVGQLERRLEWSQPNYKNKNSHCNGKEKKGSEEDCEEEGRQEKEAQIVFLKGPFHSANIVR
jgi:hypothetical protein